MARPRTWIVAVGVACVLALVVFVPGQMAQGDGDPLEEYDFSGQVEPAGYVMQSRMEVHRHGLWTVQLHVLLDPFEGSFWALSMNTRERINIYYGTRPMWCSQSVYQQRLRTSVPEGVKARGHFKRVMDTTNTWGRAAEERPLLPLFDLTGGDAITLHLRAWTGAANGGSSGQIIRLSGTTPATAKVDVLWSGAYETLIDLDEDGALEVVDTDFSHACVSYLPWKGTWTHVVLRWDAGTQRYVVGDGTLQDAYRRAQARRAKRPVLGTSEWIASLSNSIRKSARESARKPKEVFRTQVLIGLASALWDLLATGHVEEARALMDDVPLENFAGDDDEQMTRSEWWTQFLTACRKSSYWEGLCGHHSALRELD